ncbi:MAG: hypothetical protein ACK4FP_04865 [Azonexus sp.]
MAEILVAKGIPAESDASDSSASSRPIRNPETDAFVTRLKEVIGGRKIVWFAKECGLPESNIRTYLAGRLPSIDKAAAIAAAGGVTVDWLATGKGPKTRAEARALEAAAEPAPGEAELLDTYRTASAAGRNALNKVAIALRDPTLANWFEAGNAITNAANLFDKGRK